MCFISEKNIDGQQLQDIDLKLLGTRFLLLDFKPVLLSSSGLLSSYWTLPFDFLGESFMIDELSKEFYRFSIITSSLVARRIENILSFR